MSIAFTSNNDVWTNKNMHNYNNVGVVVCVRCERVCWAGYENSLMGGDVNKQSDRIFKYI